MSQILNYTNAPAVVLKSLFAKYDYDNSGTLNKKELYTFLEDDLGMDREQADTYLHLLDTDGDGVISYKEFENWFRSGENLESINNLTRFYYLTKALECFRKYDLDDNNALDKKEMKKLFEEYGEKDASDIERFMKELDIDCNGLISFDEFVRWLRWFPEPDGCCCAK